MRKIKIAMLQTSPQLMKTDKNLASAERLCRNAKTQGADICVLPEMFAYGYNMQSFSENISELCEDLDGKQVTFLKRISKELKICICAGVMLKENGKVFNSSVLVDKGKLVSIYHKNHLFGDEKKVFSVDGQYKVSDLGFAKIGQLICYDNNFPESARTETLMGAEIILCPCAWRIQDKDMFDLLSRSHALENTVFLCAVNMYGNYSGLELFGGSVLCSPRGQVIESCGTGEKVVCCEIDLDELADYRENLPFLKDM